jgi:NTP pyrophosphatase (non-canonical NTP hydrolase)
MKSLSQRQQEAAEILGDDMKHPRLGAVLALVEELGEMVQEVMEAEIYRQGTPENFRAKLGEEAADTLFSLFEVCTAFGINLEEAYDQKLAKIQAKIPIWREKFTEGLQQSRAKLD